MYAADQQAQLLHRVIDRVGNGPRDVFGHGRLLGQVPIGQVLQLVHQAQNSGLVGIVNALGLLLLQACFALLLLGLLLALAAIEQCHPRNPNTRQQHNQRQTTQDGQLHQPHTGIGRQALLQGFEFFAQGFTVAHHRTLGLTG